MSFPYPYHRECHGSAKSRSRLRAANLIGPRRVLLHWECGTERGKGREGRCNEYDALPIYVKPQIGHLQTI